MPVWKVYLIVIGALAVGIAVLMVIGWLIVLVFGEPQPWCFDPESGERVFCRGPV